jgi:hypothetical protein
MKGIVIKIEESGFGNDILSIETNDGVIKSFGFINGRNDIIMEGDSVEFDTQFFELSGNWRAVNVSLTNA